MSSNNFETSLVTLESLKEKNTIPIVQWDSMNTWFILGLGLLLGWLGLQLGLGLVPAIPLAMIGLYVGYDIVRSVPPYCNVVEWMRTLYKYHRNPSIYANTAEAHVDIDSTIRAAIETPETTRNLTAVKRFYPPHGIIERQDGSFAMMLRYTPPNMDFSTNEEYFELMGALGKGYNDSIDFDVTLHATTRPVDMEAYFEQLAERMDDADVENNDIFKALLEEMKEGRQRMLKRSDTEIVHFYFVVSVDEDEVEDVVGGDDAAKERSSLFGLFSGLWSDEEEEIDEAEIVKQRRIKKKLDNRARSLAGILSSGSDMLEDAQIDRVTSTEAAGVLESYWTGRRVPLDPDDETDPVPIGQVSRGPHKHEVDVEDSEVAS